jgi:hypothetical protein
MACVDATAKASTTMKSLITCPPLHIGKGDISASERENKNAQKFLSNDSLLAAGLGQCGAFGKKPRLEARLPHDWGPVRRRRLLASERPVTKKA